MYFWLLILSNVSASIINSDLTSPFGDVFTQDALPFHPITLDSNPLDPPLDSNAPLFAAESPSTNDAFEGSDFSDSSDLFGGDLFQIADCSMSENLPALGKSRVRRSDDTTSCSNPASRDDSNLPPLMLPQDFDPEK